jgi:ferredoxin-thioredoxin reductase catalytic subunit
MNKKSIEEVREYVKNISDRKGWVLNRDSQTLEDLIEGLHQNMDLLGYYNCPCRDSENDRNLDRDIICPCRYAEPDIKEYGYCYCSLYFDPSFSQDIEVKMIPERRPERK